MSEYIYEKNARVVINGAYKLLIFTELIIIIVLAVYATILTGKINEVKPLPIFIDNKTGEAKAVDFSFVDAQGETRSNAEVEDFVTQFMEDLYTYNRLTVKRNLVSALAKTSKEAAADIKNTLLVGKRYDILNRGYQGIVTVKSITIHEKLPDLKIQVFFNKRNINQNGQTVIGSDHFAILRIKPIVRKRGNAHGLVVVEFRENKINKGEIDED